MRYRNIFILLAVILVFDSTAQTTRVWDGSTNTNWSDPTNWTPSGLPALNDIVRFTGAALNNCRLNIQPPTLSRIEVGGVFAGTIDLNGKNIVVVGTDGLAMDLNGFAGASFINSNVVTSTLDIKHNANVVFINNMNFGDRINVNVLLTAGEIFSQVVLFEEAVNFNAPQTYIERTTFNGGPTNITVQATGSGSGWGGNNTFVGATLLTNLSLSYVNIGGDAFDIFDGTVTFSVAGSGSDIRVGDVSGGTTLFNDNVLLLSSGGSIYIAADPTATVTLADLKTITLSSYTGNLYLNRFTQIGTTNQSIILSGATSTLLIANNCDFGADNVNIQSPIISEISNSTFQGGATISSPNIQQIKNSTFNNSTSTVTTTITKSAGATSGNNTWDGGNNFIGNTTIISNTPEFLRFTEITNDTYKGKLTITKNSSGAIVPCRSRDCFLWSDLEVNGIGGGSVVFGNVTANTAGGSASGGVIFTGALAQTILGSLPIQFVEMTLNKTTNTNTVNLNTPVTVDCNGTNNLTSFATFTSGQLITSNPNYLIFGDFSQVVGASDNSFVDGPVRKIGRIPNVGPPEQTFTFPVGDDNFYRSIKIDEAANGTDHFTAQYFNSDHGLIGPWDPTFTTVSRCEYWILDRVGTSAVKVTLSWNESACNPGYVGALADIKVARWNGAGWASHGGVASGTLTNGFVTSSAAINSFSPFTLASISFTSALPVQLTTFTASLMSNAQVLLEWKTASELNNDRFEIEHSFDGQSFQRIGQVKGVGTTSNANEYSFVDANTDAEIIYYRLKQIDFDGSFEYSRIISVRVPSEKQSQFEIYPVPLSGSRVLHFNKTYDIVITNNLGSVVLKANHVKEIDLSNLQSGLYCVMNSARQVARLVIK